MILIGSSFAVWIDFKRSETVKINLGPMEQPGRSPYGSGCGIIYNLADGFMMHW